MHAPVAIDVASKTPLDKMGSTTTTSFATKTTITSTTTTSSTMTTSTATTNGNNTKQQQKLQQQKGHCRSSSLENSNNIFASTVPSSKSALFPSSISAGFSGTLKSQREQKRIHDYLSRTQAQPPSDHGSLDSRRQHFKNIREIFEKTRGQVPQGQVLTRSQRDLNQIQIPTRDTDEQTTHNSSQLHSQPPSQPSLDVTVEEDQTPPKIQSCSGVLTKGPKEVIRPIAFKPVPYRPSNNYGRLTNELAERYGSTPSLVTGIDTHHKFSSTNDLNQNNVYNNYGMLYRKHQQPQQHLHHHHHHYSSTGIPFKTYDSLESILRLPNSVTPTQSMRFVQYDFLAVS